MKVLKCQGLDLILLLTMLGLNFINLLIRIFELVLRILIISRYYHILLDNIIRVQMMS